MSQLGLFSDEIHGVKHYPYPVTRISIDDARKLEANAVAKAKSLGLTVGIGYGYQQSGVFTSANWRFRHQGRLILEYRAHSGHFSIPHATSTPTCGYLASPDDAFTLAKALAKV